MKPEKELIWSFILANSEFTGGFLKKNLGCRKDFERLVDAQENDKVFIEWFEQLLEEGIIYPAGEIEVQKGKKVTGYRVEYDELIKRMRSNPHYHNAWKFFDDRALIGTSK